MSESEETRELPKIKEYSLHQVESALLKLFEQHAIVFEGDLIEAIGNVSRCMASRQVQIKNLETRLTDCEEDISETVTGLEEKIALLKNGLKRERECFYASLKHLDTERAIYRKRFYSLAAKVFDIKFNKAHESTLPGYPKSPASFEEQLDITL